MRHLTRRLIAAGVCFLLLLFILPQIGVLLSFPGELRLLPGQEFEFDPGPLFTTVALPPMEPMVGTGGENGGALEEYDVELRLFGWLAVQRAQVKVVSQVHVVPGGQAVGILVSSGGLAVVRTTSVWSVEDGRQRAPAAEAGILPGDIILRVGDTKVDHPLDLEAMSQSYGRKGTLMPLTIARDGVIRLVEVEPVLARDPAGRVDRYMLGLYLKDPAAGVGTLTFWEPSSGLYGALGHMVTDGRDAVTMTDGRIVAARIHGIQPGARGRPGEKLGIFEPGSPLGTIEKNTAFGIFGRITEEPEDAAVAIPVALSHEVKEGPAQIRTVLQGGRVETFDIEIAAVHRHPRPSSKGLVVRVTDPKLLQTTQGIVQGMSGSPIIQDGKLIGAVTHVFINDPTRGYGVLAEWMVYEAGIAVSPHRSDGVENAWASLGLAA